MESLKKVYTYTIHIHNVYTGIFGERFEKQQKTEKTAAQLQIE